VEIKSPAIIWLSLLVMNDAAVCIADEWSVANVAQ
jgi:hypothetical protein